MSYHDIPRYAVYKHSIGEPMSQPELARYIECGFPVIPLAAASKAPVARGWTDNTYPVTAFRNCNIGTRAGERVCIDGKQGYLLILDYDSPDIGPLRQLCSEIPLPRTTCVRSGGAHHGYHLYYLTELETRKHGMLAYRDASIDLLGKGSFAVVPPSVVDRPYRYLLGLDELAYLSMDTYERLLAQLKRWKQTNALIARVKAEKIDVDEALEGLAKQGASPAMISYFHDRTGPHHRLEP